MPTPLAPKPKSAKKTLPVKWRDKTWYPRIVIRALDGRSRFEPGPKRRLKCEIRKSSDWTPRPLPVGRQSSRLSLNVLSNFGQSSSDFQGGLTHTPVPPFRPCSPFHTSRSDNSL